MKLIKFFTLALAAMTFVACSDDNNDSGKEPSKVSDIVLKVSNNSVVVGTPITFTVIDKDGNDVTTNAYIFDKAHDWAEVSNPFTPTIDDDYVFFASVDGKLSNEVTVSVVATIPELPIDAEPENTLFNHRILLVDHTGNTCGNCPDMMLALKDVAESTDKNGVSYHDKYYEAMAHSYTTGDPAYSKAAAVVSTHFGVTAYPNATYNFYHATKSPQNAAHIKSQIDALWRAEGADASVAASSIVANSSVVVNTVVKAAKNNEYRITAWLLEDNIYAQQTNGREDWMHYHDNAIRQSITSDTINGVDLGSISAGETKSTALTLKISSDKWNRDNFKVMLIVSAKNAQGKFEVANVAICPANGNVEYNYKK